jgi:hypothetical protein
MLELSKPLNELTRVMQTALASPCRRAADDGPCFYLDSREHSGTIAF